jgi:CRISPR/Cas system-associated exonuclease Cas4 (RecB family)
MIDPKALENVVIDYFANQRRVSPSHTNRASNLGHPCLRFLVFERTRWSDKALHDITLQMIFSEGNFQEEATKKVLIDAGFELTQQQRAYFEGPQNISGHLDSFISHPKYITTPIPAEIKSMSVHNWGTINSYQDMVEHPQYYVRKYPGQMMLYLYMSEMSEGLFILKNKGTGQIKFIPVELDFDYAEELLKKAENVNEWVERYKKNGEICDETTQEARICGSCPYNTICFKDSEQTGAPGFLILENAIVEQNLYRIQEIKELAKEHQALYDEVKKIIQARADSERADQDAADMMIGDWVIAVKRIQSTKYNVPPEVKKQYAEKFHYWRMMDIEKL